MNPMIRQLIVFTAVAATLALLLPAAASARSYRRSREVVWYQYAAQFTCGVNEESGDRVVRARYATAINIHNPHPTEVILRKHLALTFPPELQAAGAVSAVVMENLDRRSALQVDCGEILDGGFEFTEPPVTDYVQGFVVIESRQPLDVSATYTATGDDEEQPSVDAEAIAERTMTRPAESEKLVVCHVPAGSPDNEHEIEIDEDAWPAHREHGDRLGRCDD
jgi:hypothetical protein